MLTQHAHAYNSHECFGGADFTVTMVTGLTQTQITHGQQGAAAGDLNIGHIFAACYYNACGAVGMDCSKYFDMQKHLFKYSIKIYCMEGCWHLPSL